MKKLSKNQLKKIANMHAAAALLSTESVWAFENSKLSREELKYLDNHFEKIAIRLLGNDEPIYNADSIVIYVHMNYK